jgi:phage FluMu gp28-like protein
LTETNKRPTVLESYQTNFLNDFSKFRLVAKSRQIGFSWVLSGEALHKITTSPTKTINIVSINQKEASGKIVYAKNFFYSMPEELRPPVYTNAEYEFSVHNSPDTSYLVSQPASSAIRGGEKDIYLDEFAFIPKSQELFDAAIPATTRGNSRLTIVSTPLGQSGLFFDIANDRSRYPEFTVSTVPWWECSIMSMDHAESTAIAADYSTEDRVAKWGTQPIKAIFSTMDLESFQQEYECSFADESVSFYPWSIITDCADDTLSNNTFDPGLPYNIGIDIAKKVDKTVITISTTDEDTGHSTIVKTYETRANYDEQFKMMADLVTEVKPQRVSVDATGVGAIIAEQLVAKFGGIVEPIVFTRENKEQWATMFKRDLQLKAVSYPRKRELLDEIHTIERKKTESGNYVFKAREGKHDDYYWSAMLSLYGRGRTTPSISFAW